MESKSEEKSLKILDHCIKFGGFFINIMSFSSSGKVNGQYIVTSDAKAKECLSRITNVLNLNSSNILDMKNIPEESMDKLKGLTGAIIKYNNISLENYLTKPQNFNEMKTIALGLKIINEYNNKEILDLNQKLKTAESEKIELQARIKSLLMQDKASQVSDSSAEDLERINNPSKNLSDAQELINELINSKDEAIESAKREARQQYKEKILQLNAMVKEIPPLQDEVLRLRKKLKNRSKMEEDSQNTIASYESELTETRNAVYELQSQLQTALEENSRLSQINEDNSKSISEEHSSGIAKDQQRSLYAIDEMSQSFKQLSNELSSVINQRNSLLSALNKQQTILMKFENLSDLNKQKSPQTIYAKPIISQPLQEEKGDKILETLALIDHDNLEDELDDILDLSRENKPFNVRAANIVNLLLTRLQNQKQINLKQKKEIDSFVDKTPIVDKLSKLLISQLSFVEEISSNENLKINSNIRDKIYNSVKQIQDYIDKNIGTIKKDFSIFDFLKADPEKIKDSVVDYLTKFNDIQTDEGFELFLILKQAIAICLVLIKINSELSRKAEISSTEIKKLKDIASLQDDYNSMIVTLNKFEDKIAERDQKLKSISRLISMNPAKSDVFDQIKKIIESENAEEVFEIEAAKIYKNEINSLKKELIKTDKLLKQAKSSLQQKDKENEKLQQKLVQETENLKNASTALQDETQSIVQSQNNKIELLTDQVNSAQRTIKTLNDELNALKIRNSQLRKTLTDERLNYSNSIVQIKERSKQKMEQAMNMLYDEQSLRLDEMSQRIKTVQRQLKKRTKEVNDRDEVIRMQEEVNESQMNQTAELHTTNIQSEQKINELNEKVRTLSSQLNDCEIEKKTLSMQLISANDKNKRDESYFKSQVEMVNFSSKQEIQKNYIRAKEEFDLEMTSFLRDICNKIPEYVDFSIPIDKQNTLAMISKVADKAKNAEKSNKILSDLERQNLEIRAIVGASKTSTTINAVREFVAVAQSNKLRLQKVNENK